MLKPLIYKYHIISKGQSFVNYLFLDVIFNNRILAANAYFSPDLIISKYKSIVTKVDSEYLSDSLVVIFNLCKRLNRKQLKLLRKAVHNNNKIEQLCNGEISPVTYREIFKIDSNLAIELQKLCGRLYKYVIAREPFYSVYGKKNEFYKEVIGEETVCCCCGVGTMLNKHQKPVGALDHYFPINHYPFSSINFMNLIPICDICNSKYKTQKDTLFEIKTRTQKGKRIRNYKKLKAFFPYANDYEMIEVDVSITNNDLLNLTPSDISIDYSLNNYSEEVENWERLFNVSEIHKASLLDNATRSFVNRQFDLMKNLNLTCEQCCKLFENNLFYDKNFIRIPYFKEYHRIMNE